MKIAVTIGTTSWRAAETLTAGEVEFVGIPPDFPIWDAGLGNIRAMTAPELAALPGQKATITAQSAKVAATAAIDNGQLQIGDKLERVVRALAMATLDELNLHTTFEAALLAAIAAATTLADLKSRVVAITSTQQRTASQLVATIKAKIAATAE